MMTVNTELQVSEGIVPIVSASESAGVTLSRGYDGDCMNPGRWKAS